MKKFAFLTLCIYFLLQFTVHAQVKVKAQKIEESEVPQVVKDTYTTNFSAPVLRWEWHQGKTNKKSGERYIATFEENDLKNRARFRKTGEVISATIYYKEENLPENIKAAAKKQFEGFTVKKGQKTKVYKSNKEFYRVRLNNGAQKGVFFSDLDGNPISKKNIPKEASEDSE